MNAIDVSHTHLVSKVPRNSDVLHFHDADISQVHEHHGDLFPTRADGDHLGTIPSTAGIKLCLGDAGLSKPPFELQVIRML